MHFSVLFKYFGAFFCTLAFFTNNKERLLVFFDILQNRCTEKGIKVTPLLLNLGLSKGNISKWKNGTLPNGEILIKIADYLDCSVDYLLGRTDNPEVNK